MLALIGHICMRSVILYHGFDRSRVVGRGEDHELKHWSTLLECQIGETRPGFPQSWLAEDSILDVFFTDLYASVSAVPVGTNWYRPSAADIV